MRDISGALAKAGAGLVHWITSLGPYSWNEIVFVLALIISTIVGVIAALSIIARHNRAIEFIDQSEVVTSPLRNRAAGKLAVEPNNSETEEKMSSEPAIKVEPARALPAPKPTQPLVLLTPAPVAAPVTKTETARVQLVLAPLGAGSGNIREIAHANAITQRLKVVLATLAPHIEIARDDKSFGESAGIDRYTLTGVVRHMGDRIRLQVEMTNTKTGANLFRFRYQGLPNEQDVMLAEITSRVLKATARPASERKNDAA